MITAIFYFISYLYVSVKCLQKLVKAAVRFIYTVRRSASTTGYLKKAHILPVRYRIQYKLCLLVYKILHGMAPSYMNNLLHPRTVNRANLRSSVDDTVMETSYSQGTIARCMCEAWNALPIHLRNISKIESFKTSLKTHYFIVAFE